MIKRVNSPRKHTVRAPNAELQNRRSKAAGYEGAANPQSQLETPPPLPRTREGGNRQGHGLSGTSDI